MAARIQVFAVVLVVLLLTTVHFSKAQQSSQTQKPGRGPTMTSGEILATLKPGQWAQLEGPIQKDSSILCTVATILTGDFLNDAGQIIGVIKKLDDAKQEIEILRPPIKIQKDTGFSNKTGNTLKSFADLKVGMFVEATGTYLKDGTFLAKNIQDKSGKLANEPGLAKIGEAMGKVENVDFVRRTVTLMGVTFRLTDDTRGKSAIK